MINFLIDEFKARAAQFKFSKDTPYLILNVDLAQLHTDLQLDIGGDLLKVISASDNDATFDVKLNFNGASSIPMFRYRRVESFFNKIFITNTAQAGKTIQLLIGVKQFFHVDDFFFKPLYSPPVGVVWLWNGLLANIPTGWEICDGAGGKPDLRHKFVRGAGAAEEVGHTGGSDVHLHLVTGNVVLANINHRHSVSIQSSNEIETGINCIQCGSDVSWCHHHNVIGNTGYSNPAHLHAVNINSQNCSTLPTYYEIIFIIRI